MVPSGEPFSCLGRRQHIFVGAVAVLPLAIVLPGARRSYYLNLIEALGALSLSVSNNIYLTSSRSEL
eukprot:1749962-Pleurochrysis_carterae.AAC.1